MVPSWTKKSDAKCLPVLAVKDSASGSVFAHGAPGMAIATGEYGEHTVKAVVNDIDSLGYKRILLKSDQQPSIKVLQQRVKEAWTGEVVKQNSPVASSQSNGRAEKAIRDLEGHLRTLKLALDSRLGLCVPTDAPAIRWLVEHSADFTSRFRVGRDGKTARERIIGKRNLLNVAEFGESVFHLPLDRDRGQTAELDPKLQVVIWLGLERSTNEAKIGTPSGVLRARTVRRRLEAERWRADDVLTVAGTPWNPVPGTDASRMRTAALVPGEEGGLVDIRKIHIYIYIYIYIYI